MESKILDMERPLSDSDLVIATPERVSFDYQVAGLGTRAIAQLLDLLIVTGLLIAVFFFAFGASTVTASDTVGNLISIIGTFMVVFGYFWISEALWSGQTLGKKAFRLRAVGDRGEPLTFIQAGIRNVVRIVDFLPYGYGVGMVVLFANGRGKRLGDLAAGTIVVKDSDHVWLWQLAGGRRPVGPPAAPPPSAPPADVTYQYPAAPPPPPPGSPLAPSPYAPASAAELTLRRLDPELRRFVTSYARRRPQLPLELRVQLASKVQSSLRSATPDVFSQEGPLAALDYLADLEQQ
ncbi:MAG TPA: RDD family protein [Candidatus Limnocylindria bacterium]|nr:RDD family protein [Candidatus Limnocylindria bacterium]